MIIWTDPFVTIPTRIMQCWLVGSVHHNANISGNSGHACVGKAYSKCMYVVATNCIVVSTVCSSLLQVYQT